MRLMLRRSIWGLLLLCLWLVMTGCGPEQVNPTPTTSLPPGHGQIPPSYGHVPRISPADVMAKLDAGEDIVIVDARKESEYLNEHVQGALSVPADYVKDRSEELPRDKEIVFYCT